MLYYIVPSAISHLSSIICSFFSSALGSVKTAWLRTGSLYRERELCAVYHAVDSINLKPSNKQMYPTNDKNINTCIMAQQDTAQTNV